MSWIYLLYLLSGCTRVLHGLSVPSKRGKHELEIVSSLIHLPRVQYGVQAQKRAHLQQVMPSIMWHLMSPKVWPKDECICMNSCSFKRSPTLKRLCSLCYFSCGLMKSFTEESNCLSLVIGPHASLTDSLQQYMNVRISAEVIILHEHESLVSLISWCLCLLSQASFIDCVCSLCGGPQASETLKFLSLPRYDTLLISYWSGE